MHSVVGLPALQPRRVAAPPARRLCARPHVAPPRRRHHRTAAASASLLAQLSDAAVAVQAAASASPELDAAGKAAADAAQKLADNKSGFLGGIANVLEGCLSAIDGVLSALHVPYSYGFSIIVLTLAVKAATFPLSRAQIESTTAMQALTPRVKDLQARYATDQERLQRETAKLYQEAGVNPLAGCLPTLATLPVFIGLYRALTNAASDGLLTDAFFFIPSLGGPSSMADNSSGRGLGWLLPLTDGAPPIGWHDALAYLSLPVLLVVSQFASQKIMQPPNPDPSAASANAILKFLPFMVGWFALNVPSGLTLYWLINNLLTTAQTVYLRNTVGGGAALAGAQGGGMNSFESSSSRSLPPNPPRVPASMQTVDVEVLASPSRGGGGGGGGSSGSSNGAAGGAQPQALPSGGNSGGGGGGGGASAGSRPGARFAQLKAAEAQKKEASAGRKRPGGGGGVKFVAEPPKATTGSGSGGGGGGGADAGN